MKIALRSYKIAGWVLVLGGLLHSIADLATPKTAEQMEFILQMRGFTVEVLGSKSNMFSFFQGFSFMMGLLLFGYGALNLLILKNNQTGNIPSNVLTLNIIITLVSVMLSIKYFFIVPIAITSTALLGFLISGIVKIRQA